jgi:hypothetical protein
MGEGIHDWAFVLGRWHAVDQAGASAAGVKGFGMALLFAGFVICLWNLLTEVPGTQRKASKASHGQPTE